MKTGAKRIKGMGDSTRKNLWVRGVAINQSKETRSERKKDLFLRVSQRDLTGVPYLPKR